jgi:hypothetical protein
MHLPDSNVITLFPARSISNICGANVAKDAIAVVPLLPEARGTLICIVLLPDRFWLPDGHINTLKFLALESADLNNMSVTTLAFVLPLVIKVYVLAAKLDDRKTPS